MLVNNKRFVYYLFIANKSLELRNRDQVLDANETRKLKGTTMPEIYLTDSQLEKIADLLYDESENGEDLLAGESKELSNLAEEMIRKIGDEGEEVDLPTS